MKDFETISHLPRVLRRDLNFRYPSEGCYDDPEALFRKYDLLFTLKDASNKFTKDVETNNIRDNLQFIHHQKNAFAKNLSDDIVYTENAFNKLWTCVGKTNTYLTKYYDHKPGGVSDDEWLFIETHAGTLLRGAEDITRYMETSYLNVQNLFIRPLEKISKMMDAYEHAWPYYQYIGSCANHIGTYLVKYDAVTAMPHILDLFF